jgi:RNA polymerase sigma-70 factor (ECF subfamily)
MLAFKAGDGNAFAELVRRYQRPVMNFFFKLVWDVHLSEDYAQEVFIKLYRHAATYEDTAKFSTFLFTIARNLWIDHVRRRMSEPHAYSLDASAGDRDSALSDFIAASDRMRPERIVEMDELGTQIRAALAALPDDQRMVVVLSEVCGLRYQEISQVMKIPVGTVKSRMHTAVYHLRSILSKKERPK